MHGLAYDATHDEIVVPVALGAAVLTFRGGATGSEAPVRTVQGPKTHLVRPHTLTVDEINDEIWVANYGDHTAEVFSRTATGNASPKRIVRNAPAGTPTGGFGNPYAVAYDSKRDQLLVPN